MLVEIFNVEHGGCTLVTADNGYQMMIDCGHNSSTNWRPSEYFPRSRGIDEIEMFIVTNFDEDHVSDLKEFREEVTIRCILKNKTITPENLAAMKREGGMGNGIKSAIDMMKTYTGGSRNTDWGNLSYQAFRNSYGDFTDTNNLSLVIFLHCNGLHMVFPGDLEKDGWKKLLENDEFRRELETVNVFVASHHGRESGCCEEIFTDTNCEPDIFILSDQATQYNTQLTIPWYRQRAGRGIKMNDGKERRVFTTRSDGKITLTATVDGYQISLG